MICGVSVCFSGTFEGLMLQLYVVGGTEFS